MTIPAKKNESRNLLLNFSPWLLAIACTLLLLMLAVFTVSNYRREKELMGETLVEKGLTLIRFINSVTRESMRDNRRSSDPLIRWEDQVHAAMEQAVEQPGVETILLVDRQGTIISAAGAHGGGATVNPATLDLVKSLKTEATSPPFVANTYEDMKEGKASRKFQMAAWHLPPGRPGFPDGQRRGPGRGQMMRNFYNSPHFTAMQEEYRRLLDRQLVFVVQLDFEQFNSSLKRQFFQIIILSVVTLLVGVGGALSYMTLRGLRGSQQSLGEMRAFTEILVSALPIGLIATDSLGVIRVCNQAAVGILGIDATHVQGKFPKDSLPQGLARMFTGNSRGETGERQQEILLEHISNHPISLHLASMAVVDDDKSAGEVLLIRDLTAVKLLERELRRSERLAALGKMAAGVAHELRNPLSSIKGLAVLLRSQLAATGCGGETAEILVKEVERLNRSIGELLDYARPGQLKKEYTSLNDIIGKIVSLVQVDAESYDISIEQKLDEKLPLVAVDPDKINQVLLNLLLNAIQAMPDGGHLSVRTEAEGEMILVRIRDNGVGIDPENLLRVFDPYFTTKSNGTGLGLSLSAKSIEEHGGQIKILSTPNEFTEVRVILPLHNAPDFNAC